jgi:hypothetical protein
MRHRHFLAGLAAMAALSAAQSASAHAVVGNRFFPATLSTDDPGVADELSLPTVSSFRTGDDPAARELDVDAEWSKRITHDLGISFEGGWTRLKTPDRETAHGFQNLETTLKYQFLTNPEHEAILAAGVSYEWGGTGAARVGAEGQSAVTPTLYFGKGAGDLPDGLAWARPCAVTGLVGYAIPTRSHEDDEPIPRVLTYGLALEYSFPYLAAHVRDLGLPEFVNGLTPLVEASFETPVGHGIEGKTTGSINPGVIWSGRRFQVGAEAMLPINRESGTGAGLRLQLHLFLDDLFPRSIGKPLW